MEADIFQFLPVPFRSPSGILPVCGLLDYHFPQGLTQFHSPSGVRGSLPVTRVLFSSGALPVAFRCPSGVQGKVHATFFNVSCVKESAWKGFSLEAHMYFLDMRIHSDVSNVAR